VDDDRFGDDGAKPGHALAEPPRDAAAMKRKIGAACTLNHVMLIEWRVWT